MNGYLKKAFFILLVCAFKEGQATIGPEGWANLCYESVQDAGRQKSEIKSAFSHPESYAVYKGQEGYLLFVKKTPISNSMDYIFNLAAKDLGKDFKRLGWKPYQGEVEEFERERGRMFENGELKTKYKGPSGQALYAKNYYAGNMNMAFQNVAAVLSQAKFEQLEWREHHFSAIFKKSGWRRFAEKFIKERGQILDESGELKTKYKGPSGQALYATDHYAGDMRKAFQSVSEVLTEAQFKLLDWQNLFGSVAEVERNRGRILDENGQPLEKYKGLGGQALYATDHYAGDMNRTFMNTSASLTQLEFKKLGWSWKPYQGSVKEFERERGRILDESGKPIEKYKGENGLFLYAIYYYAGDMNMAFQNVAAAVGSAQIMKSLGWMRFVGSASEYKSLFQMFKENDIAEFQGEEGLKRVASEIFNGHRQRAYKNVSVLRKSLLGSWEAFEDLGWAAQAPEQ